MRLLPRPYILALAVVQLVSYLGLIYIYINFFPIHSNPAVSVFYCFKFIVLIVRLIMCFYMFLRSIGSIPIVQDRLYYIYLSSIYMYHSVGCCGVIETAADAQTVCESHCVKTTH